MKAPIVIDTNVLLAADGRTDSVSGACAMRCAERLNSAKSKELVVLDARWIILGEYSNKLNTKDPQSPGAAFLYWLHRVLGDPRHVSQVGLTPKDGENYEFEEFPQDHELRSMVDKSDRKFIATANAHPEKPPIVECSDSKWLDWESRLSSHGIQIEFICRDELEMVRARKQKKSAQ